ncbi:MAG: outer membrane protein assembly factor BamE [Pseudomonadota bacterium]
MWGARATLAVFCTIAVAGCSATFNNHGYVPVEEELAQIEIGATRDEVLEIIGSPGSGGVMRDEAWLYTAYRVRNFTYRPPEIIERDIVAVSFTEAGTVSNIQNFGLEDGQIVRLSRRVTDTSIGEVTFLQQILSNFGQLNVGNLLGADG